MIGKYLDGVLVPVMGAALLVVLVVVGWMSYQAGAASGTRAAAAERERALQAEQAATRDALARLQAAQTLGDALSRQLAAATRAADRLRKDRNDAIPRATTGRVCLDEPALRVLDGAPGLRVDLSGAAGGAAGADAGHVATDTHVARWALDAGGQYDACRRRLDTLIRFHEDPQQSPQGPQ